MKNVVRLIGLLLLTVLVAGAATTTLTFEKSGKTIKGEVIAFAGDTVIFKDLDGNTVSIPVAYLTESDRTRLAVERAKEWKLAEVIYLLDSVPGYHKCAAYVKGEKRQGVYLIRSLPRAVESILIERKARADKLNALWKNVNSVREEDLAGSVTEKLYNVPPELQPTKKAFEEFVATTKSQRTVEMRCTGTTVKGVPVWECRERSASQTSKAELTPSQRRGKKGPRFAD
jgi:hypothetical protein